ncbi:M15 family metallopeptidase [Vibrio ziniensis]|uniref:M15 family metallopeptidase n=1 Tax=Vibrio ziniensis TaxID=2711221 RepID=A0A6G7CMB0_9VIBR|nr:M15 family metallopeptidase [Vibrio ziniensis]QIH43242.1 M15 family metallopeptidase [Vibrio ziniensis]
MTAEQLTGKNESHLTEVLIGQKTFFVHPDVRDDLLSLKAAADRDGFNLNIASGFRSFERQLDIWNRKMSGEAPILDEYSQPMLSHNLSDEQKVTAILRWSALPGASRHHWGTDFDVFDRNSLPSEGGLKLEPWEYLQDHQHDFYFWLKAHLTKFGFFFPYQENGSGVAFEPWHISHKNTAEVCLQTLTLEQLSAQLDSAPILGKEYVHQQLPKIYNQYVTNISTR